MHLSSRSFSLFSLFMFATFISAEEYISRENIQSSILHLLNSRDRAISLIEADGKVYLNPDTIVVTEKGLFVKIEQENYLQIPLLISGEHGCYTVSSNFYACA